MLGRVGAISSLCLAFAISSCGWFADYELEIVAEDNATEVEVKVKEKGKSEPVTSGDGATLEVTLSVSCGDADAKEHKVKANGSGVAKFTKDHLNGEGGDTCELEASADNAKSADHSFKRG